MSAFDKQKNRMEQLASMPKKEMSRFIKLLKVQSNHSTETQMVAYICSEINKMGLEVEADNVGNLLVTKGKADVFPCICSHMDTVHEFHKEYNINIRKVEGRYIAYAFNDVKQVGTGGDDKCGVYACLYMLRHIDNIKVAFFSKEETGFVGSNGIDHSWFEDVGYIIQLDRWGRSDFISKYWGSDTVSDKFNQKISHLLKSYKFSEMEGLITDSINLWNNYVGLSCVNISCGYYEHHTSNEIIDLNELWNSILFTHNIIKELGEEKYPSEPEYRSHRHSSIYTDWSSDFYEYTSELEEKEVYDQIITESVYTKGLDIEKIPFETLYPYYAEICEMRVEYCRPFLNYIEFKERLVNYYCNEWEFS